MVDWSSKLEAVHTDGRTEPVGLPQRGASPYWPYMVEGVTGRRFYFSPERNESCGGTRGDGWTLRNPAPAWRTSAEQLDRMDALVQRLAAHYGAPLMARGKGLDAIDAQAEARDILAAREPVDPDIAIAQQICDRSPYDLTGLNDQRTATTNEHIREAVLAGIKYGRAQA